MKLLFCFGLSFVLSCFFTFKVRAIALHYGWVDKPSPRKMHKEPIPLFGGIAILITFILINLISFSPGLYNLLLICSVGTILLIMLGVWDAFLGTNPYLKMGILFAIGLITASFVLRSHIFPFIWLDILFSTFWIAGITNAFNYIDNMDGLAAGLAVIAGIFFAIIAMLSGQTALVCFSLILSGTCLGFLVFNFNPASIFMGDVGSYFIGYILAIIGLNLYLPQLWITATELQVGGVQLFSFIIPILVLGIPIFDTIMVTILRPLSRRKIVQAGKDHCSHRLVNIGLSPRRTVIFLYFVAAILGLSAVGLILFTDVRYYLGFIAALSCAVVFIFHMLSKIKVYSN